MLSERTEGVMVRAVAAGCDGRTTMILAYASQAGEGGQSEAQWGSERRWHAELARSLFVAAPSSIKQLKSLGIWPAEWGGDMAQGDFEGPIVVWELGCSLETVVLAGMAFRAAGDGETEREWQREHKRAWQSIIGQEECSDEAIEELRRLGLWPWV